MIPSEQVCYLNISAPPKEIESPATTYPRIGLLCLLGITLHLFLTEPVLLRFGIHYADENNGLFEKLHPGTYVIILSFVMLLIRSRHPLTTIGRLHKPEGIYTTFLSIYVLIFSYMVARSSAKGLSFLIDTQICAVMAATVLCYTPVSYCRRALYIFIGFAVANSLIGICEGMTKWRLFEFDPTSSIAKEPNFRASALLGHPLSNAIFTSVMLFVTLGVRLSTFVKLVASTIFLISLVAFGGRTGLIVSCLGVGVLGLIHIKHARSTRSLTLLQMFLLLAGIIIVPALCLSGLYVLINSSMGERLLTDITFSDSSAASRALAWRVFNYIKPEELIFGMAPSRVIEIMDRMNLSMQLYQIENPWILMFMHLGLVAFPIWLAATFALMWRLMYRNPLAIKLAVVAYLVIASGSNSFGVKGSMYLLMVSAVICASRSVLTENPSTTAKR
ncbi:MAG: VpsF family polysaccharide biosynthesis protein [Terriglobales bacterium]|jgi:hypothetical protein